MKNIAFISIVTAFFMLCGQGMCESNREKHKSVTVATQSLSEMARIFSRAQSFGIAVCIETEVGAEPRFSIALTNVTLEAAMTNIASVAISYNWNYDDKANVVNLCPKDSMLNWTVSNIDVENVPLEDMLFRDDTLKLKEHGISFFSGRGNLSWLKTPITLKADHITVKQALNLICNQIPFKARWELRRTQHKDKTTGVLSFQGCY